MPGSLYSIDLRDHVIVAVEIGGLSRQEAAAQFWAGLCTAIRWVKNFGRTGHAASGQMGDHKPRNLIGAHRVRLIQRCTGQAFTLRGLVVELAASGPNVG